MSVLREIFLMYNKNEHNQSRAQLTFHLNMLSVMQPCKHNDCYVAIFHDVYSSINGRQISQQREC
jgi:hypothetical protein